jgi:phytoene dehydrogenase-like protein
MSAVRWGTRFDDEPAAALFAGLAAHSAVPLEAPLTAGPGLLLGAAADAVRWPVARGGSQTIADALVAIVVGAGGEVRTGVRVRSLAELPADVPVLFDTSPRLFVDICGDRLTARARQAYLAFRHGAGAMKIDYLLHEPIPWSAPDARRAGTVHVGGTLFEVAASEQLVARGQLPDQPFLLVGQPTIADPGRAPAGRHLAWAYCHVPQGVDVDGQAARVVAAMEAQLERFAPGFADVVEQRWTTTPGGFEAVAPNQHGGDFAGGSVAGLQLLMRPTRSLHPYRTPIPGHYLCSASTPPGPGAHGMCGWHAAGVVLRHELRDLAAP